MPRYPVDHHNAFVSGKRTKGCYIVSQPVTCTHAFEPGHLYIASCTTALVQWPECYIALGCLAVDARLHSLRSCAMQLMDQDAYCGTVYAGVYITGIYQGLTLLRFGPPQTG